MLRQLLFIVLAMSLALTSCDNSGKQADSQDGDMSQFAEDTAFQEKHKEPASITFQGKGQMVEFSTPDDKTGSAYLLMPEEPTEKFLFVIHEWWGLNDHIKKESERLFDSLPDVAVMALDIYDGKVADTQEKAGEYMQSVNEDRARAIISGAMAQAGSAAKIATIGWCFGGGWSLKSAIMAGNQGAGCVVYYGMPVTKPVDLAPLKADVLGIFAKEDQWITPKVVEDFEKAMKTANKDLEVHMFEADHAFANPSGDNYEPEAAKKANALALEFLRENL